MRSTTSGPTDTYLCEEYKLKTSLTDLEVDQAESELRLRQTKTEFLAQQMNLAREIRVAALLMPISLGGQLSTAMTSAPSVNWDQATATIEADLKTGKLAVYDAIGIEPNTLRAIGCRRGRTHRWRLVPGCWRPRSSTT